MIITCPECSAKYKVRDELIPESGKKVRCKKCNNVFRAYLDGRMLGSDPVTPQPAPKPAPQPTEGASATVMIDADHIQRIVAEQRSGSGAQTQPMSTVPTPQPAPQQPPPPAQSFSADLGADDDFGFGDDDPFEAPKQDERFGTVQMRVPEELKQPNMPSALDAPLDSDFDRLSFETSDDQYKEEVSQYSEQSSQPDFSFSDELDREPEQESLATQAMPAITDEMKGFPDIGTSHSSEPEQMPKSSLSMGLPKRRTYVAMIEGTPYSDLTLDKLERWIKECRLLESDQIATAGSSDYQRADAYPEIAALFGKYFGDASNTGGKKKGFFARLFGK
ncbi:MAG: zinc-ribbon domain-containing protein [Acidobacteria bacterium]|nr:zinc-ribbon domain-containing protein [Acidobacteriota bacterium]